MNMSDIGLMLKNMQNLKSEVSKVQEKLSQIEVESSSGGGMVKVVANARMQILQINIEKEIYESNDKEMVENLIVSAVNQVIEAAQEKANEQMNEVTGGMLKNLPEGFNIPGVI